MTDQHPTSDFSCDSVPLIERPVACYFTQDATGQRAPIDNLPNGARVRRDDIQPHRADDTGQGVELSVDFELSGLQQIRAELTPNKFFGALAHHIQGFAQGDETVEVSAPHLMNALGRRPATDGLGLEAAGVDTLADGAIACNGMQQTSNPRVYASGDVADSHQIVHIAIMQGEIAARHATGRAAEPVECDQVCLVVFTDPQVGVVGLSEAQLKERGIDYLSADYPFDDHGKSILMEAKAGYVKVLAAADGTVLGAECVGKDAGELIHSMAVAVSLKANVRELMKVHWYHPTLSEIWTYPIEDILDEL